MTIYNQEEEQSRKQPKVDLVSEVIATREQVAIVRNELQKLKDSDALKKNSDDIDRILKIIDGDPETDVLGLRQRVKTLEIVVETLTEDKKQTQATLRGIAIGLALTGVTGAGTFVTMLVQVFGGGKP